MALGKSWKKLERYLRRNEYDQGWISDEIWNENGFRIEPGLAVKYLEKITVLSDMDIR